MAAKLEQKKKLLISHTSWRRLKPTLNWTDLRTTGSAATGSGRVVGAVKKYEFKRWTADVEAGKWLQAKGRNPQPGRRKPVLQTKRQSDGNGDFL